MGGKCSLCRTSSFFISRRCHAQTYVKPIFIFGKKDAHSWTVVLDLAFTSNKYAVNLARYGIRLLEEKYSILIHNQHSTS